VLALDAPEAVLVERLTGRQTCSACAATFNRATNPARIDGQCDACGGRLITRPDDQPETVRRRLQAYQAATAPVLGFLAQNGWPVRTVPSVGEVTDVYGRILAAGSQSAKLMGIQLKTPAQIAKLREANLVVSDVLDTLEAAAAPGLSTWELNDIAAKRLKQLKADSAFLGYRGYPAVLCTSVNEGGGPRHTAQRPGAEGRGHPVHRLRRVQGRLVRGFGPDHPVGKRVSPTAMAPARVDPGLPGRGDCAVRPRQPDRGHRARGPVPGRESRATRW
jgi:hypothetical protein